MKQIVFFDLETTGTNTEKDRIVEIALYKVTEDGEGNQTLQTLVNPEVKIPLAATDVHHITDEMVADKPKFKEIASTILDFMSGCAIGGYNSNRFDIPLLMAEFGRCGISWPDPNGVFVDVYEIEKIVNSHKLGNVYKRYTGSELESAHEAMADVVATIEVIGYQVSALKNMGLLGSSFGYKDLDQLTQSEKKRLDFGGRLTMVNDKICWAFGKHQFKPINCDLQYAQWVLSSDFPADTKQIIKKELGL